MKLIDEFQISVKSENNKRSIEFETESDVVQIDTKKTIKMIIFSDPNKFTEKNEFRIDD